MSSPSAPLLMLAPMQDVTTLGFLKTLTARGGADHYVTEFFRVHAVSRLEPHILRIIRENPTGRPIDAQLIGDNVAAMIAAARELLANHPVANIDLNLGCPAPVVISKNCGGGMLRFPDRVERLVAALREEVPGRFGVKLRVGFDSPAEFPGLLKILSRHQPDRVVVHGRTVRERYQSPVHTDEIRRAVEELGCPVIANGNAVDVETTLALLAQTGAAGVMIGRGAIRNPWIFRQVRERFAGGGQTSPRLRDLWDYVVALYIHLGADYLAKAGLPEGPGGLPDPELEGDDFVAQVATLSGMEGERGRRHVQLMKRFMVYIAQGLDPAWEHEIRRVHEPAEFWRVCRAYLLAEPEAPVPVLPPETSRLFCGFAELLRS